MTDSVLLPYPDPPLTDGTVLLRRWLLTDLGCVEEASHDPYIPETTTVPENYSDAEGRAWIERQWARADDGIGLSLAIVDARSGDAVGLVVLMVRPGPRCASVGYWIIPRERGRGCASRAVGLLAEWALTHGGLARIEAFVEPDNAISQRILEGIGFLREEYLRSELSLPSRRADVVRFALTP